MVQNKDVIFNCAAQTSHPLSLQNPIHDAQINCVGNLRLLEAVRLLNPNAVVVYTSSSTVIITKTIAFFPGARGVMVETSNERGRWGPNPQGAG